MLEDKSNIFGFVLFCRELIGKIVVNMAKKLKQSSYVDTLNSKEKDRYLNKTGIIGIDPYEVEKFQWSQQDNDLPRTTYIDIVNYLISNQSCYTMDQLKAYKSLDAYNYFVSGWVRECVSIIRNGYCVVTGKVMHSQKLRDKPVQPWIIAEQNGTVLSGHCTCMAGIGEVCSHVAALLFLIESTVRIRDAKTVTEEKAYWMLPSTSKVIDYRPIRNINFKSASTMKMELDAKINNMQSANVMKLPKTPRKVKPGQCEPPTEVEFESFLKGLSECNIKPAILSLFDPYSEKYEPKVTKPHYPQDLSQLYNENCLSMCFAELLTYCKVIDINVSGEECKNVEAATRDQASSNLWYTFRAGRITASRFKAACHTDPGYPSVSLIKNICYPHSLKFRSAATTWGCEHEIVARSKYLQVMQKSHSNFEISLCGLILNPDFSFMGASPDGLINCNCCEVGCLEIKCPYCKRNDTLTEDPTHRNFCLISTNGQLKLDKKHAYYYQVQCQIQISSLTYCDFVVWTQKDIYIERIYKDEDFLRINIHKAKQFFTNGILPELVARFYTRKPILGNNLNVTNSVSEANCEPNQVKEGINICDEDNDFEIWCYCRKARNTKLIACDNENCLHQWFHFSCVGVVRKPKGKWYCPDCRKFSEFKRGKKKV